MKQALYDQRNYELFRSKLSANHREILCIIGENPKINKQTIIDKSPFSKTVVNGCIEALHFAGFVEIQSISLKRQTLYELSMEGQLFVDYLIDVAGKEGFIDHE
ncbi:hypothetical protein [Brevibacillus sp. SYSU BS000544]|uniref:hypothetical protein n=1 Tax=Brevibacillus sp. SYSU BS000544 TaxID=3416443 RepID=UPI003CE486F4